MPDPAPSAWSSRPTPNTSTVGAAAHTKEATTNRPRPETMTCLRPYASETGPYTACETATPIMNALNVHCTDATGVPRACAVAGTPGRLMSEANRPPAFSEHSTASSSA